MFRGIAYVLIMVRPAQGSKDRETRESRDIGQVTDAIVFVCARNESSSSAGEQA